MRRRHTVSCSVLVGLICSFACAATAESFSLLRVPGVQGNSEHEGFEDWFSVSAVVASPRPDFGPGRTLQIYRSGETETLPDAISVALSNLGSRGRVVDIDYTLLEIREDAAPVRRVTVHFSGCQLQSTEIDLDEKPVSESFEFSCGDREVVTQEP